MKKRNIIRRMFVLVLAMSLFMGNSAVLVRADIPIIEEEANAKSGLEKKAESIVKKQVKKKSSKKSALKQLFTYTEKTYGYKRVTGFKNTKGWEKTYAKQMYSSKKGSCYHFAAAYAFLAKKATGYPVRICIGKTNGFNKKVWQAHAWAEVKIGSKWYICDPNMDKFAAKSSGKYYLKDRTKLTSTYKTQSRITVAF